MFEKLDIYDFFEPRYEGLNSSSGIGAMGFITSKQVIQVFNDIGEDKMSRKVFLGIGDHDAITKKVFKEIYGNTDESNLYDLISIKYLNSKYFKIISFYFPNTITLDEYRYLEDLYEYYKYIFEQYKILVSGYEYGKHLAKYGPIVEDISDISTVVDLGRERMDLNLTRDKKERILKY